MRKVLPVLGAIALIAAIGFFVIEAGRILGFVESPTSAPGGAMGPPGGRGPGGASGYPGAPPAGATGAVPVEVASAVASGIRERVSGSGILEPAREVTIVARVEGEVEELLVEEGSVIASGGALCAIDEAPLRLAEEIARIERDQAKRTHERLVELLSSRSVSPQEIEDARFAMERATASYGRAALDLAHARPTAPFAGVVVDRAVEIGQSVRPGDPLFTIADFDPLRLRLRLPESAVGPIVVGQVAELRATKEGSILTRGSVERISPVVDRESLTVEVVVDFEFASGEVRPGSFAHVDIITRTEESVILVPRRAVLRADGESFIYRIAGGRAQRVVVLTGYEDDQVVQVREGISAGDRVAVEGVRELRDGAAVEVYREATTKLDPMTVDRGGSGRE